MNLLVGFEQINSNNLDMLYKAKYHLEYIFLMSVFLSTTALVSYLIYLPLKVLIK